MVEMCSICGATMMTTAELRVHKRLKHGFAKAEQEQRKKRARDELGIPWIDV